MLIKACLNGSRAQGEHPALPLTSEQLASAARLAVGAGAGALHVHPRRADGTQSLEAADIAAALVAIRAACPGIPVGISTGIWIEPDVERRRLLVATWDELPDFAGVNFSEPGALDLCAALVARAISVEAGRPGSCTGLGAPPGQCSNSRFGGATTHASASKIRSHCLTDGRRRTTLNWSRLRGSTRDGLPGWAKGG
jgi:hypothetical protein